jgi:PAS domain S-box-containing protein
VTEAITKQPVSPDPSNPERQGTHLLAVLFVDDDPADVELECAALRRDFVVHAARVDTAAEFKAALATDVPEIILCDYQMPRFSGLEALALWKQARARIPFIFVTGKLSEEVAVECIKAGATDYCLKGNLARLPMAVDRALREFSAATALQEKEGERARVTAAVYQAEEVVVITEPQGRIVYVNPAFTRVTGYGPEEAVGRTPRLLQSGKQDKSFYEQMWRRISAGEVWRGQLINRRRDGSLYDAEMTIAPVFGEAGRIVNYCAIQRDVSARVAAERELRELYTQLAETDRLKDEFLAAFSHELRTPLNVILGYADVMIDTLGHTLGNEARSMIDAIARSGSHLAALINETLDLARLRIDAVQPQFNRLEIGRLVGEVVEAFRPLAADKGLSLTWVPAPAPIEIVTDPTRLRQILTNLIDNAIKFTDRGGVRVAMGRRDGTVAVEVSDTGIGVAATDIPRMFEDFRQLDGGATRRYGGCGLGLALARRLIDLLGGKIEVESSVGEGTIFRVCLPPAPFNARGRLDPEPASP